ncbi:MAG: 50S ribosome-binding GTPase [Hormoscilla sp. GM102CHS1]|nr:50S ribosome-binding GTPase [Hormoscilla sp. GM102CHS1]
METYDDLIETIMESYQKAQAEIGQCNILIIGKTGVGKSTLINAVFREPLAETGEGYLKKDFPLRVYDTPGLELETLQLKRVTKDVGELIKSKKRENVKEHIHVVWYCINHNANRLEEIEKEWLKSLDLEVPIILILTQTLTRKRSEFTAWLERQNLPVRQIIPVLARPKEIDDEHIIKEYGLDQIVQTTLDLLPEVAQKAFINATKDINIKARRAFNYVTSYATAASSDLSKILLEQYKYYVQSGRKTMQEEEEPKNIPISTVRRRPEKSEADDGVAEK